MHRRRHCQPLSVSLPSSFPAALRSAQLKLFKRKPSRTIFVIDGTDSATPASRQNHPTFYFNKVLRFGDRRPFESVTECRLPLFAARRWRAAVRKKCKFHLFSLFPRGTLLSSSSFLFNSLRSLCASSLSFCWRMIISALDSPVPVLSFSFTLLLVCGGAAL